MRIINKVLKDKPTLTYTYTIRCAKCGYQDKKELLAKNEIDISRMKCPICDVVPPIPQRIIPEEPPKKIIKKPVTKVKKIIKPKKQGKK